MRADGKNLSLKFGTVEVACVSTSALLDSDEADSGLLTFADVVSGNTRQWFFSVSGYPDYAPGTFWSFLWDQPAFTPVAYRFAPYGNATASPAQPHFTGQVTVDRKPPVGGDASSAWSYETRLTCTANPTRVTA